MKVTFFQWMPSSVCAAPAIVRFSTRTLSAKMRDMGGSRISAPEGMLVASRRLPPSFAGLSTAPMARIRGAPTKTWPGATLLVRAELFADLELGSDEESVADDECGPAALDADEVFAAEFKGANGTPAVREPLAACAGGADDADEELVPGGGTLDSAASLDGGAVAPIAVATSSSSILRDDGVPGGTGSIEERSSASSMRASVTCAVSRELV